MNATKSLVKRNLAFESFDLLCKNIDTEYSKRASSLIRSRDFDAYASLKIIPSEYATPLAFGYDYLVYAYLRKYRGFKTSVDLEAKARLDFEKIENQCRETNKRIVSSSLTRDAESILSYARRKIAAILLPFNLDNVIDGVDWGNGATESLRLRYATIDKKILEPRLSVTRSCHKYAHAYLEYDLHWTRARLGSDCIGPCRLLPGEFRYTEEGRFTTVEKTVKARRSIDIQPTMNLFFQKGVGRWIRKRLQRYGIDLDDQSVNQSLAKTALDDGLATIDLANASDSVSRDLVRLLLPPEWYEYLDDIRTHYLNFGKGRAKLEKFSSMGNGFTFELESLIFFAICDGVRIHNSADKAIVSVYGDDIVVSSTISRQVCQVLNEVGFEVNVDKTYLEGQFYESCGKHYFSNKEVTPVFQKEEIVDNPSAIRACNRIYRVALTLGGGLFLDHRCKDSYDLLRRSVRTKKPLYGPGWLEGEGFIKDPYFRPNPDQNGIFYVQEYREVVKKRRLRDGSPLLANTLRNGVVVDSPLYNSIVVRGDTRTLLATRRVYLVGHEVPVWASSLS